MMQLMRALVIISLYLYNKDDAAGEDTGIDSPALYLEDYSAGEDTGIFPAVP